MPPSSDDFCNPYRVFLTHVAENTANGGPEPHGPKSQDAYQAVSSQIVVGGPLMSWRGPRLPVRPGCWGARLIERWLRDQQGSMLVCRKQVVWRDQYGPTPRWDPRYRNGRPDKVSRKLDVRLGGRFRNHHIHHSNDLVLGPAIRTLQPLHLATVAIGDSAHGMRGSAGPAPNARYEVHSTPLSLRPLASHNHQVPQYPQNAALSAAEEEAPSFSLSKGDPATTCAHPSVPGCRCSRLCEASARSSGAI